MDEKNQKRKPNRIRPLWRDLMTYTHSLPNLQEYLPGAIRMTPIYSAPNGLLGFYYTGENSKTTQRELSRIKAEEDYLWHKYATDPFNYPFEKYRDNRPKREAIEWNPEKFISEVGSKLPSLMNAKPYTPEFRAAQKLANSVNAEGSSYIYQANPTEYSNVNPMQIMTATGEKVKPGQGISYLYPETDVPYPENWKRNVPLTDLREIFSESEWPVIHENWPERSVVEVAYYPNTPGSQRIADYYGFKAMEDEARREFYNTPPVTMVMPRAIERPQIPYDPLVAGYLPLMQQEQPARSQQNGWGW